MIRRLTGKVVGKTEHSVVLEVNNIGYLVFTPQNGSMGLGNIATLHTHLVVRENVLDLYGFQLEDELELFEQLLTLPKIGPKSALQILAQASLVLIKTAITNNDPTQLSKMSGLGKKTSEKVVAGLIEIYEKQGLVIGADMTAAAPHGNASDTIDALVALGYPENDARKVVQRVTEANPTLLNTNDILKEALKDLSTS